MPAFTRKTSEDTRFRYQNPLLSEDVENDDPSTPRGDASPTDDGGDTVHESPAAYLGKMFFSGASEDDLSGNASISFLAFHSVVKSALGLELQDDELQGLYTNVAGKGGGLELSWSVLEKWWMRGLADRRPTATTLEFRRLVRIGGIFAAAREVNCAAIRALHC